MVKKRTKEEWKNLIDNFEKEKINVTDFCDKNSISRESFYKWRSTFEEQDCSPKFHEAKIKLEKKKYLKIEFESEDTSIIFESSDLLLATKLINNLAIQ